MSNQLVELMQQIATNANRATSPVKIEFGTVTRTDPLIINVDQKKVLTHEFLTLCRAVTDYDVDMTVNHVTEKTAGGGGDPAFASHMHKYKGTKKFRVLNALKVGEKVAMIAVQGGGKYLIIDRVTA